VRSTLLNATLSPRVPDAPPSEVGLRGERMPHLPGLDGLRGLAVIGVLLFHGGFTWAKGGFLGVSTFFTLSGFLITNLLVREFDTTRTIALGRFWVRRFRRLLPAALVAIALIGLIWWRIGTAEQLANLRGDVLGSLAYVANWRFYSAGTSYAELFSAPSPLQHFWSLAIEEQFYLFFPPIVWGVMKVGGRRLLTGVLVAAVVVSVGLELLLAGDVDRVYYGTDTRAAELLLGCLLAVWWSGRRPRPTRAAPDLGRERSLTVAADAAGVLALAGVFAAWFLVDQSSSRLAQGGFPVYALLTTVVIYAVTRAGLLAGVLSVPALRGVGLVSYGLYLYHWPIFLLLDEERTGLSVLPLFVVRMAVTGVIAVASYFLLEQPIRRGTMIRTGRQLLTAGVAGAVVVASVGFLVTLDPPRSQIAFGDAEIGDITESVVTQPPPDTATSTSPPATGVVADTVFTLGDSGMLSLTPALTAAFLSTGTTKVIEGAGPGFGLSGEFDWRGDWAATVADDDPDLVIIMLGGWDLKFIERNGVDAYAELVDEAVGILSAGGAKILWLPVMPGDEGLPTTADEVFATLPERFPGVVANPWVGDALADADGEYPKYLDVDGRTLVLRGGDGWHLCQDGAQLLAESINEAAVELGWSAPTTPGWESGDWRSVDGYDDPPGACDPPDSGTS
jgi:peptidoglycan/LPS O-acetylase OafA/YrhL/lysophospholipase L1-like esterase